MGKPVQVQLFPLDLLTKATSLKGLANGFRILQKQIDATCESVAITPEDEVAISVEAKGDGNLVITKVNENLVQDFPLFHQEPAGKNGKPASKKKDKPARKKKDKPAGKKQAKGKPAKTK